MVTAHKSGPQSWLRTAKMAGMTACLAGAISVAGCGRIERVQARDVEGYASAFTNSLDSAHQVMNDAVRRGRLSEQDQRGILDYYDRANADFVNLMHTIGGDRSLIIQYEGLKLPDQDIQIRDLLKANNNVGLREFLKVDGTDIVVEKRALP